MGRYQEQVARRNARYEYEIPDGALHCEIVTGTEATETTDEHGTYRGSRTWRGVRYLLRLDPPELEDPERALRDLLGESLMRARLALTAIDLAGDDDPVEAMAILSALCGLLVEAGAIDPMEAD